MIPLSLDGFGDFRIKTRKYCEQIGVPGMLSLVLEAQGTLVGFSLLALLSSESQGNPAGLTAEGWGQWASFPAPYIVAITVGREHRKAGLGIELLQSTIQWARTMSDLAQAVHLDVAEDNKPAVALFKAAGFTTLGPSWKYPAGQQAIHMRRSWPT